RIEEVIHPEVEAEVDGAALAAADLLLEAAVEAPLPVVAEHLGDAETGPQLLGAVLAALEVGGLVAVEVGETEQQIGLPAAGGVDVVEGIELDGVEISPADVGAVTELEGNGAGKAVAQVDARQGRVGGAAVGAVLVEAVVGNGGDHVEPLTGDGGGGQREQKRTGHGGYLAHCCSPCLVGIGGKRRPRATLVVTTLIIVSDPCSDKKSPGDKKWA